MGNRKRKLDSNSSDSDVSLWTPKKALVSNEKVLLSHQSCCDLTAESVLFFLKPNYKCMSSTVHHPDSVEDCLEYILKFVSNPRTTSPEGIYLWRNQTMKEIKESVIDNDRTFRLIHRLDTLDWKVATEEEKQLKYNKITEISSKYITKVADHMIAVYNIYREYEKHFTVIEKEKENVKKPGHKENKSFCPLENKRKSELLKKYIEVLGSIVAAPGSLLRNSLCKEIFKFEVGEQDISDSSNLIESRSVSVVVNPDAVFSQFVKGSPSSRRGTHLWSTVVGVTSTNISSDDHETSGCIIPKPKIRTDQITSKNFKSHARDYIMQSLPTPCRSHKIINKLAGQHVMQLFTNVYNNFGWQRHWKESVHYYEEDGIVYQKAIGMFFVHEHLYFSRLDIREEEMDKIIHSDTSPLQRFNPSVTYSNVCLDITKSAHRLALILFLKTYLYPQLDSNENNLEHVENDF